VYQRVEDGRSAQRRDARAHESKRVRRPDVAQLLALQQGAGNHAVSRVLQRSPRVLARVKVLGAKDTSPREVQKLPAGFWFRCENKATNDVVWIFSELYENLATLLPGYVWTQEHEFVEEDQEAKPEAPKSGYEFGSMTPGDRGDIGLGEDYSKSHLIHFGKAIKDQKKTKDKLTIDPTADTPDPAVEVEELTDDYPGTITAVHYLVPAGGRTHWEIMCAAERPGTPEKKVFRIKFDFTANGYRMIYKASSSSLETRKSVSVTVPVKVAMHTFRKIATQAGSYEDGSNTCGTFARSFFYEMTGEEAEPMKKKEKKEKGEKVVKGSSKPEEEMGSEYDAFL
jgi:hypothetical protein